MLCLLAWSGSTLAAPFQNLGFESATFFSIPGDPHERVQFAPALPGWTGYVGGVPQTLSLHYAHQGPLLDYHLHRYLRDQDRRAITFSKPGLR
jgi:hypothetical protein